MPQTDPMLAKIRKLLAKAEDPAATPEEAETYTVKAAALIAAYGIDAALLAAEAPGQDAVGDRVVGLDPPYARDKAQLLCDIANRLRCRSVLRMQPGSGAATAHSVHLFGHESDLARTDVLFTSLLMQSTSRLTRTVVPPWEHKAAFRRSWLAGFRMSISRRLAEAESRAESDATERTTSAGRSTSVVLADRSVEVEQALRAAYPRVGTARPRQLSGSGLRHGYLAGQEADLGHDPLPGNVRELHRR